MAVQPGRISLFFQGVQCTLSVHTHMHRNTHPPDTASKSQHPPPPLPPPPLAQRTRGAWRRQLARLAGEPALSASLCPLPTAGHPEPWRCRPPSAADQSRTPPSEIPRWCPRGWRLLRGIAWLGGSEKSAMRADDSGQTVFSENNTAAFFMLSSPSFTRLIYSGDVDCTHRVQRSVRGRQKIHRSGVVSAVD